MKTPEEIAESIVPEASDCPTPLDWQRTREWLCRKISAAIQAERDARPPKGHIVTDDGVTRRVLGELPVTADGCVVGDSWCGWLFWIRGIHNDVVGPSHSESRVEFSGPEQWHRPHNCYSTREAAEAAKKENT